MTAELKRKAADRLLELMSHIAPSEDAEVLIKEYEWVVAQLALDPDFHALILGTLLVKTEEG